MAARPRFVVLLALTSALGACSWAEGPRVVTEQGREVADLWRVFFWVATAVGAIVLGLILWSIVRYRKRGDELPPQLDKHIPLEVAYTLIPVLIVVVLFVLTYRVETDVESLAPEPAVTIDVTGFTWSWRFDYRDTPVSVVGSPQDPPTMVVPTGVTVRVSLTSRDVVHSFYVPEALFKRDATPGRVTEFDLRVEEPGLYAGHCAEFCGLDHARMTFTLSALPVEDFETWLAAAAAEAAPEAA